MHAAMRMMHKASAAGPPLTTYKVWYDATKITGVSDATLLTTWPDSSGNGFNLGFQGGNQPTYYSTTSAKLVNGKPAVWCFDSAGVDAQGKTSVSIGLTQPFTMFVVGQWTGTASEYGYLLSGAAEATFRGNNTSQYELFAQTALVDGGTFNTSLTEVTAQFNGASSVLRQNGTQVATGNPGSSGITTLYVAASSANDTTTAWHGPLCEILIYPSALSGADMASVESYLKTKWGTP